MAMLRTFADVAVKHVLPWARNSRVLPRKDAEKMGCFARRRLPNYECCAQMGIAPAMLASGMCTPNWRQGRSRDRGLVAGAGWCNKC